MRINHNISAINTNRLLGSNNSATSKSLEKLSSGLRVNRAGDDAAGLAISEKMRGQIRGLNQASSNANDGISLIQTAEGALNETHSILQRMRELAVQSANDTNTASDRTELQKEIEQLTKEITRISTDTEFNTQKLLDGSMAASATVEGVDGLKVSVAAGSILEKGDYDVTITFDEAPTAGTPASAKSDEVTVNGTYTGKADAVYTYKDEVGPTQATENPDVGGTGTGTVTGTYTGSKDLELIYTDGSEEDAGSNAIAEGWYTQADLDAAKASETGAADIGSPIDLDSIGLAQGTPSATGDTLSLKAESAGTPAGWYDDAGNLVDLASVGLSVEEATPTAGDKITATAAVAGTEGKYTVTAKDADGNTVMASNFNIDTTGITDTITQGQSLTATVTIDDANAMTFHIGANSGQNTKLTIQDMGAKSLGVDAIDLTTQASADAAITTIDDAINTVSAQRAALGAMQNRLEHTINNLGTSSENLSAAESQIRDVDMAEEMSEFTKNNILVQAATAMLAQANQQPQNVLSLLQ